MGSTRRESRERITADLMAAARRQLADVGAAGLSLRAVARELGMVSSAVYRYVPSRDELLTRLIVDAYDSLGAAAEAAAVTSIGGHDLDRWLAIARSIRQWALEHPNEYQLLYGTPVPGYAAPDDTVAPGTRVTLALLSVVRDAIDAGRLAHPTPTDLPLTPDLRSDLAELADTLHLHVEEATFVAFAAAWTQLFGLIGFELTNQTRGAVTDHAALFVATVAHCAHHLGLRGPAERRSASGRPGDHHGSGEERRDPPPRS